MAKDLNYEAFYKTVKREGYIHFLIGDNKIKYVNLKTGEEAIEYLPKFEGEDEFDDDLIEERDKYCIVFGQTQCLILIFLCVSIMGIIR